jgi:hypothetical protein
MPVTFSAKHFARTQAIELKLPVSQAFGLFDPYGEKLWAAGWEPQVLYPASAQVQEGMVFMTDHPGEASTVWAVATYDQPNYTVSYWRFTPESRLAKVSVRCEAVNPNTTQVYVTYEFTGLSENGNAYIEKFSQHYDKYIKSWQTEIEHYLQHSSGPNPLPHLPSS